MFEFSGTFTNEYNNIYILVLHSSNTKMVSICLHESYEYLEKVLSKSQANSKNTKTPLSSNLQDKVQTHNKRHQFNLSLISRLDNLQIRQDEQTTAMQTIVFELCSLDSGTYNWYTQCLVLLRAILRRADFSFTSHLLYALLAGTEWCFCQKLTRLNWSNIVRLKRYLASFQACH
jgi:hypothetical protein